MYQSGLIAATEHIDRQTDDFGKRVESLLTMLITEESSNPNGFKNLDDHPYLKKLAGVIENRLGLKVKFFTNGPTAAIMPFYSNRNHIFLDEYFRGYIHMKDQVKVINQFKEKKGTVNLKTAVVGGIFSEYEHKVYLNITRLVKEMNCTAGEITAALLHELGHGFSACYYADRTDRTNQVLATLFRKITNPDSKETLEYIYEEMHKVTDSVKKEHLDKILNGPRVIAGLTFFKVMVQTVRSQISDDKYSDTSFEQLADSFAARFGYGQYLSIVLEKIHHGHPEKNNAVLFLAYMANILTTAAFIAVILGTIVAGIPVFSVMYTFIAVLFLYSSGERSTDYTYDNLKTRYKRIRQDAVDQLKNAKMDRASASTLLDTIYALDAVIESTKEVKLPTTIVSNFIFSSNREAQSSIEAQKLLETLGSNDLFVAAAEFKQLS